MPCGGQHNSQQRSEKAASQATTSGARTVALEAQTEQWFCYKREYFSRSNNQWFLFRMHQGDQGRQKVPRVP